MKAVIVEASGSMAVALREDGSFVKIQNKGYSIGDELTSKTKILEFPKRIVAAACSALVFLAGASGIGAYQWNSPYSYVTLDVNPSIEYSLNKFDKVIAVNGLNEAGNEIALSIGKSIKNRDLTKALEITVDALNAEGYADDIRDIPLIGVYSNNDSKTEALMATASDFSKSIVALTKDDKDLVDSGVSLSEIAGTEDKEQTAPATEDVQAPATEPVVAVDENVETDSSVNKAGEEPEVVEATASENTENVVDSSPAKDSEPVVSDNTAGEVDTPASTEETEIDEPSDTTSVNNNESPVKGDNKTPAKDTDKTSEEPSVQTEDAPVQNQDTYDDTNVDVSPAKK